MNEFVNRTAELERLRDLYDSPSAELAIVFGRRRLGKTELVKQSVMGYERAIVYQARQKTGDLQRRQFVESVNDVYPDISDLRNEWEVLLSYLIEQDAILVLDEFPYLIEQSSSLPSVIQALFDHELDDSSATLVLVGSSIGMMEDAALLGDSPLYGRASEKLDVGHLPFADAMAFVPESTTPEERVILWSIFGGVPYYLERLDPGMDLATSVSDVILSRHGVLHDEPDYVLRMELTEPTRYFSILEAIAGGNVRRNEIAGTTGIEYNHLSKYLDRLSRLRIIERRVPVTEDMARSKRSRYLLTDPLFRFWFRFVYGSSDQYDDIASDPYDAVIAPEIADFAANPFEDLCRSVLRRVYPGYTITDVGGWWYAEREIDVVGLASENTMITGECKFQQTPMSYDVLSQLEDDASEIRWAGTAADEPHVEYVLFSRGGFTRSVEEAAETRDDVTLLTAADVLEVAMNGDRNYSVGE